MAINGLASSAVELLYFYCLYFLLLCSAVLLNYGCHSAPVSQIPDPSFHSATSQKQEDSYPFNMSSFTRPPFCDRSLRSPDGILSYPRRVRENILSMNLLSEALSCLDTLDMQQPEVQRIFEYVRDRLYFPNSTGSYNQQNNKIYIEQPAPGSADQLKRRLPWLNPEDGCMVRAEFMTNWAHEYSQFLFPSSMYKFFLFGDSLILNSTFSRGTKYWYYHVAPLVHTSENDWLILDPSIDYSRPIKLQDWILSMTNGSSSIEEAKNLFGFAITSRFPYWPSSQADVKQSRFSLERVISSSYQFLLQDLMWVEELLRKEWSNVLELGMDPKKLLGDEPPWIAEDSGKKLQSSMMELENGLRLQ